ncbi:MAG: protein kinase domain-containing protein, partial [Pseudonocardia sp.]
MADLDAGAVIGGLRIDAVAGRGGMGVVYRATQLALNRTVAVKVVASALADDPEFRQRFKRECELAASIDHPHVVPVLHAGEEDGRLYVTMRFVDGTDLRELILRDGRLDPARAADVVNQVGGALDAAHARGLVHRDVKPANILIGAHGHAYLTDFGLTKQAAGEAGLTRAGTVLGTLDYIAPEQLEGRPVDARADVYALGCVFYQALTGRVPYPRDSDAAKMWAHVRQPPPRLAEAAPDLPRELEDVVARAMAKDPADRYASAGELGRAAVAAADGTAVVAVPDAGVPTLAAPVAPGWAARGADDLAVAPTQWVAGLAPPTRPAQAVGAWPAGLAGSPPGPAPRSRVPLVLGLVAAAVVLLAVVGGVIALASRDTPEPPPPAAAAGQLVGTPITVDAEPLDIEAGEGFLWTANSGSDTISKITPGTGRSEKIVVGGVPTQLAVDAGAVWVWNYSDSVTRVDVASGQVSEPLLTGPATISGMAVGGGYVWLSHEAEGTVTRLNMTTLQVEGEPVQVGAKPISMAFGDGLLYVVNTADRTISALDGTTGQVLGTPLAVEQAEGGIEVRDGTIYLGTIDDVTPVDERSYVVGTPIPLKGGSLFAIGDGVAWVAYPFEDEVRRIDLRTLANRGDPVRGVGKGAGDLVVADDGVVWMTNAETSTVVRITPPPEPPPPPAVPNWQKRNFHAISWRERGFAATRSAIRPRAHPRSDHDAGMPRHATVSGLRSLFPDGIATAKQLVAAGVPERTVYNRCLEGGPWQRILPGVILLFTGQPTRHQLVMAAIRLGGPTAVVTGQEACRRHGLRRGIADDATRSGTSEVHILVPAGRQIRSVGFVHVERTGRPLVPVARGGVLLAPVPRACIDAVRRMRSSGEIAELLSDAVQRRLCSVPTLVAELGSASRRGTALPRRVLRDVEEGVRSAAERHAKHLWRRTGLPEPWWNATVYDADGRFVGVADCWLDDVAMAWEIESTEWHLSPADHDRSVERASRFAAAGIVYTASKPTRIRDDPAAVAAMLRDTYRHASARPRPQVTAVPGAAKPHSRH